MKKAGNTKTRHSARSNSWGVGSILDKLGPSMLVGLLLPDGTVIHANRAALDAVGCKLNDVVGLPFETAPWWRLSDEMKSRMGDAVIAGGHGESSNFVVRMQTASGVERTADFSMRPVFDAAGQVAFLVPSACNIGMRRSAQRRLSYVINHDALTGLANRRLFRRELRVQLECAKENACVVTLLCIDLDHFGRVNATFGGRTADHVLLTVSRRIARCLTPGDKLARLDGDQFVVSLGSPVTDPKKIALLARSLLVAVSSAIVVDGRDIFLTASIGVACSDPEQNDAEVLMRHAAAALRRAKASGRNSHAIHDFEDGRTSLDRDAVEAGLRSAIGRGEFHLLYQPHVDMLSGEIVGVEALLRWEHPVLGPIDAERFIPVAEEIGLMESIGEWVIDTACAQGARWKAAGLPIRMVVNVSAHQLRQPDFSERIARVLEARKLDPACFGIEVTEHLLAPCMDEVVAQLERLRAMQVEIALDDFGTGQSSLTCLRRLPIDIVKIDRSLIKEITSSSEALSITRAIIGIAHSLGIKAFAEGIENEGQFELLAANRCDRFQGYHFSAPISGDEMERLLRAGRTLQASQRRPGARARTVVIVDNDHWVREKLSEQIGQQFGEAVRVEVFDDSQAALQRLRQCAVSVVICALRMPGADGMAILSEVRTLQPNAARMMLIGPADIGRVMTDPRQVDVFRYLSKPWVADQFLVHLQAALDHSDEAQTHRRLTDATQLVQYGRRADDEVPPKQRAARRKGIAIVDRGPLGEVLMPQSLPTLPGDLWAIERIHIV